MDDNTNQQILAELRKIRWQVLIIVTAACLAFVALAPSRTSSQPDSWERVTSAMRRQDFPTALSVALKLVDQQPNYYYGHSYLGAIYLAMGDVTNAETQYSRACQLFPNEESEKDLAAVRKRLAAGGEFKLLTK